MKEINEETRDRYYKEVSRRLSGAGYEPQPQEDGLLPVDWEGSRLCRVTAGGGAQFREEHLEREGGRATPPSTRRGWRTYPSPLPSCGQTST